MNTYKCKNSFYKPKMKRFQMIFVNDNDVKSKKTFSANSYDQAEIMAKDHCRETYSTLVDLIERN